MQSPNLANDLSVSKVVVIKLELSVPSVVVLYKALMHTVPLSSQEIPAMAIGMIIKRTNFQRDVNSKSFVLLCLTLLANRGNPEEPFLP